MELNAWWVSTAAMLPVMLLVGCLCFDDDPTDTEMQRLLASRGPCFAGYGGQAPQTDANEGLPVFPAIDFPLFQNRGATS